MGDCSYVVIIISIEINVNLVANIFENFCDLFGSYAENTYTDESDLDFYIVVSVESED